MRTAFTARRHQIVTEAACVEQVDETRTVRASVMRGIDEIAVSVCMWTNDRLEYRAHGRIEDRGDVMATTAAHPHQGAVVSFVAEVVQRALGHGLAFGRAEISLAAHLILRIIDRDLRRYCRGG